MSSTIFLDTAFVLALYNKRDQWHSAARRWQSENAFGTYLLNTTQFILTEIGDAFSAVDRREQGAKVIRLITDDDRTTVINASPELFARGYDLYKARSDKAWGMTDCISMVAMRDHNVTKVLTMDQDFRQAGFETLLTSQ